MGALALAAGRRVFPAAMLRHGTAAINAFHRPARGAGQPGGGA